jgi:hypothetical protein
MTGLRLPAKFLVLGLLYVIAVAAVGYSAYLHLSRVVDSSEHELTGIEQVRGTTKTMQLLQSHRGLSAVLFGDTSMRSAFANNEVALKSSFASTAQGIVAGSNLHAEWQRIHADWERLHKEGGDWAASDNFFAHNRLLDKLQTMKRHIADESTLLMDPDIDAHYLLEASIQTLPLALETIGQIRGLGAGILAKKKISGDQQLQMRVLLSDLSRTRSALSANLADTVRYNPGVGQTLEHTEVGVIDVGQGVR